MIAIRKKPTVTMIIPVTATTTYQQSKVGNHDNDDNISAITGTGMAAFGRFRSGDSVLATADDLHAQFSSGRGGFA